MASNNVEKLPSGTALRLLRSQAGNVMPMAAIAMIALAGLVGGGVDASRAYMVQNRLQNACDAGVLAGRKAVESNGFDGQAHQEADTYFATNFDEVNENVTGTAFIPSTSDEGDTIDGVASTTVETAVMSLFGFDTIPLSVDCTASMSVGNSDIMMVLDTTGSMAWDLPGSSPQQTRIEALREAMKNFYDTVDAATSSSNSRIRYGFVPYSSSVNVGRLIYNANPGYLVDRWTYQSKQPQYKVTEHQEHTGYKAPVYTRETSTSDPTVANTYIHSYTGYTSQNNCKNASPQNTPWTNDGASSQSTSQEVNSEKKRITTTSTTQPQKRDIYFCYLYEGRWYILRNRENRNYFVSDIATEDPVYTTTYTSTFKNWKYKAVNYDTSSFKSFNSVNIPLGSNGSALNSLWKGCIEERDTVRNSTFSWTSLTGYNPSGAYDLEIDEAPNVGDPATQWRPMWKDASYIRYSDSSKGYYTSAAESDHGDPAASFCPVAARLLGSMTKSDFDNYADSLSAEGATYHNLGMVWGARLASPDGIWESNVRAVPSNGNAVARHLIFMTDGEMSPGLVAQTSYGIEWLDRRVTNNGYSDATSRHSQRFLASCAATKAKGIRVWVIAFASELTANLEQCASAQSSFTAANASSLNSAFQQIAKDVGELRITQ